MKKQAVLAILSLALIAITSCGGKDPSSQAAKNRRPGSEGAAIEAKLTGSWIEVTCHEGETDADHAHPAFFKGIVKFSEHSMNWSSKLFDDKSCTAPRPTQVLETPHHFTITSPGDTTDGSVQVNIDVQDENGQASQLFGLLKMDGGMLYMTLFQKEAQRPKVLDTSQAQAFTQL